MCNSSAIMKNSFTKKLQFNKYFLFQILKHLKPWLILNHVLNRYCSLIIFLQEIHYCESESCVETVTDSSSQYVQYFKT